MKTNTRSIIGLLVIVAGIVAWRAVREQRRVEELFRPLAPASAPDPSEPPTAEIDASTRRSAPEEPGVLPPESLDEPDPGLTDGMRSLLAQRFDEVTASFLTERLRMAELLDLVRDLAERSLVVPESLQIERDQEGVVRFARGELLAGDLLGTFLIEEARYSIEFRGMSEEEFWSGCSLHVTFDERQSGVAESHATVQFHPRPDRPSAAMVARGELLAGWGVSLSSESGARAIPITMQATGEVWNVSEGSVPRQEFPWISDSSGFEAWWSLLQAYGR